MLAPVSTSQPIQNSFLFQHNASNANQHTNDLVKKEHNEIKAESSSTSTQKSVLSQKDLQQIQQLKSRDLEVKAHEQAHLSAAGAHASGGASFSYTTGPNGVRYATGGEVNVDTSTVNGDPSATLRKADAIRRAALAPANPSSQDRIVASKANSMAREARVDLVQLTQQENKEPKSTEKQEEDTQVHNKEQASNIAEQNSATGSLLNITV